MEQLLIGRREAAEALGICLRTLDYMITRGQLVARRIGRRVLIPRSELERFAKRDRTTKKVGDDGAGD
ncbi:MAG: helix-turn-helix domain-containing protein [Acidobacteria bacterium]|nr:helix-turn-helix domain-containing protein [Acidobacteriota bacterium]